MTNKVENKAGEILGFIKRIDGKIYASNRVGVWVEAESKALAIQYIWMNK